MIYERDQNSISFVIEKYRSNEYNFFDFSKKLAYISKTRIIRKMKKITIKIRKNQKTK